jgi:hypothetical protein
MNSSTTLKNNCLSALNTLLNAGAGAARAKFYTGSPPANPGIAATGTLIANLAMSDPALGSPASGSVTANAISSATAGNSGAVGYVRLEDSDGNGVADLTVTESGGGGDIIINDVDVVAGATVAISSLTFTHS